MLTREELTLTFKDGAPLRSGKKGEAKILGTAIIESDLLQMGFTKPELRKLVKHGLLKVCITTIKNSWRTTYYVPDEPTTGEPTCDQPPQSIEQQG